MRHSLTKILKPYSIALLVLLLFATGSIRAQELDARLTINYQQVEGTNTSVFETLETTLSEFLNERAWTNMQFKRNERITCNFNITVSEYSSSDNTFECTLLVQSIRPVYGSNYTTTTFSYNDTHFDFEYQEYDQIEFREDVIDDNLTAVLAYYAYLIIGIDMDTMSPLGGTEYLQTAQNIVSNAQSLSAKGWKAFEETKSRYTIINDMLDNGMEPFRQMQYSYYREGLDEMSTNVERGRANVTKALGWLKQARENKPMSTLPQIFTEYKRDELVSIYQGHGTSKEKEEIVETLRKINASQNSYWRRMLN